MTDNELAVILYLGSFVVALAVVYLFAEIYDWRQARQRHGGAS